MTSLAERQRIIGNIVEACENGATLERFCRIVGVSLNCWYRWQRDNIVVPDLRPETPRGDPALLTLRLSSMTISWAMGLVIGGNGSSTNSTDGAARRLTD